MNLNQLRFVVATADSLSFSQAAKTCCVTQPTLSNGIAQLEEELGDRVFDRNTRRVRVTPFGEHILPWVHSVLEAQNELVKSAAAFLDPELKLVRIGQSPLVDATVLAIALDPFKQSHQDVDFFFKECFLDDLDERIEGEKIDIGLRPSVSNRPANILQTRCSFYEDALYFIPRDTHPAVPGATGDARLDVIAADTFVLTADGCGLAGITEALFEQHGHKLSKYPGQALSYQVLQDWADLGVGSAILPLRKISRENRQRARPLLTPDGEPISVRYEAVWKKDRAIPNHTSKLCDYFRSTVPKLVRGAAA